MRIHARRLGLGLRDVAPVVVVAWLVFQLVRGQLLERYLIPTGSMEPVFHGDAVAGDVVLVDKTAWWERRRGTPRPFDVVVVRNRPNPEGNLLVKRLVAVGPARVRIEAGDLRVGPPGVPVGPVLAKEPLAHPDLRQTAFVVDPAAAPADRSLDALQAGPQWSRIDRAIELRGAPLDELRGATAPDAIAARDPRRWAPHHLSTAGSMDSSFLSAHGVRLPGGHVDVRDVGLELALELDAGVTALHLVVELLGVCHGIEWQTAGSIRVLHGGEPEREVRGAPPLPSAVPLELSFGYLDGRLFATLGATVALLEEVEVPWSAPGGLVLPGDHRRMPANLLHVGVAGDGAVARIRRVRGFHDVHYLPGDRDGYELEAGEIFLLGDNSYDSSDSRASIASPFRLTDLVGAPIAILAPPGRMRWL